jgi:antitoxin HicB
MARAKTLQEDAATRTFTAVIEADEEDGGFVVTFPAIPDLATQGETLEEARQMAEDCLRGYLEVLRETGRPLPKPSGMPTRTAGLLIELTIPTA